MPKFVTASHFTIMWRQKHENIGLSLPETIKQNSTLWAKAVRKER